MELQPAAVAISQKDDEGKEKEVHNIRQRRTTTAKHRKKNQKQGAKKTMYPAVIIIFLHNTKYRKKCFCCNAHNANSTELICKSNIPRKRNIVNFGIEAVFSRSPLTRRETLLVESKNRLICLYFFFSGILS